MAISQNTIISCDFWQKSILYPYLGNSTTRPYCHNRQLCALLLSFLDGVTVPDAKRSLRNRREEEEKGRQRHDPRH